MKRLTCIGLLILASLNWGCGGAAGSHTTPPPAPATPTISSLDVSPTSKSIGMGGTQQFAATAHLSDGTTQDMSTLVAWSSSDPVVAPVSGKGLAKGAAAGTATISAQTGSFHASASLDVTGAAGGLQSITISPAASSMPVHTSRQFTATGVYSDGSTADVTNLVAWSSTSTSVASISASGLASSLAAGTTTIAASYGGAARSTTLTVTAPTITSIAVTPDGFTVGIGIEQQFVATATYSDGTSSDLTSGVTWSSSSTSVATIDGAGIATTVGAGATTITATVGALSDTADLTVVAAHLISISVSSATPSIAVGTNVQFTAIGSFDDGSTQALSPATWSSSSTTVATVDSTGLAAGLQTGTTTITAASGSVSGTATLTVTGASLVSLTVAPANSTMPAQTTKQFTATGTFSDTSMQDISGSVVWSSSNPAAATIASTGVATSVATGTTTIAAAFGTVNGSTSLTVSTAHLTGLTITPANPRISQHTSIRFTAAGTFSDGSTGGNLAGVSWKSSKPSIASIRSSGIAHGKKSGSATITASASGVSGSTTLTVGTGTLSSLAISPASVTCALGTTQQFAAVGTFSDASTQDMTLNSHWSSSSASVATIANAPSVAGLAQCSGAGSSSIGANSGGTTGSATLTAQ